jgi:hypothetical protein
VTNDCVSEFWIGWKWKVSIQSFDLVEFEHHKQITGRKAMHLPAQDVERFYRIWFPLLYYVNQQRHLVEYFPGTWGKGSIEPSAAVTLRDALWADDSLHEAFIAENPAKLPPVDLALVASWKYRIAGSFFVIRYLKKYTVFLSGEKPIRAYAVMGLVSPIEDIIGPYLPIYVKAVLLPFEGKIIYDSLLVPYNVSFGGGYRRDLNAQYRNIQEREGITTVLAPDDLPDFDDMCQAVQVRNKKILVAFQKDLGQAGLSPKMMEQHCATIATFAQEYLLDEDPPRGLLELTIDDMKTYLGSAKKANPVSFKRFVQFLRNTDRMDYELAESILEVIKHRR